MAKRRRGFGRKRKPSKIEKSLEAIRRPGVAILYGLSGLFTVVVGALLLARPQPSRAADVDAGTALLAASSASPYDAVFQTTAPIRQWDRICIARVGDVLTARGHFTILSDAASGAQIALGSDWLEQRHEKETDNELRVVIANNASPAERAAAEGLVRRLCERFAVDWRTVRRV